VVTFVVTYSSRPPTDGNGAADKFRYYYQLIWKQWFFITTITALIFPLILIVYCKGASPAHTSPLLIIYYKQHFTAQWMYCECNSAIVYRAVRDVHFAQLWPVYHASLLWHRQTSGSAMAEGPRDALVSRNSATYKTSHLKNTVSGLSCGIICRRTDRHTTTACTALSIASRGKNRL